MSIRNTVDTVALFHNRLSAFVQDKGIRLYLLRGFSRRDCEYLCSSAHLEDACVTKLRLTTVNNTAQYRSIIDVHSEAGIAFIPKSNHKHFTVGIFVRETISKCLKSEPSPSIEYGLYALDSKTNSLVTVAFLEESKWIHIRMVIQESTKRRGRYSMLFSRQLVAEIEKGVVPSPCALVEMSKFVQYASDLRSCPLCHAPARYACECTLTSLFDRCDLSRISTRLVSALLCGEFYTTCEILTNSNGEMHPVSIRGFTSVWEIRESQKSDILERLRHLTQVYIPSLPVPSSGFPSSIAWPLAYSAETASNGSGTHTVQSGSNPCDIGLLESRSLPHSNLPDCIEEVAGAYSIVNEDQMPFLTFASLKKSPASVDFQKQLQISLAQDGGSSILFNNRTVSNHTVTGKCKGWTNVCPKALSRVKRNTRKMNHKKELDELRQKVRMLTANIQKLEEHNEMIRLILDKQNFSEALAQKSSQSSFELMRAIYSCPLRSKSQGHFCNEIKEARQEWLSSFPDSRDVIAVFQKRTCPIVVSHLGVCLFKKSTSCASEGWIMYDGDFAFCMHDLCLSELFEIAYDLDFDKIQLARFLFHSIAVSAKIGTFSCYWKWIKDRTIFVAPTVELSAEHDLFSFELDLPISLSLLLNFCDMRIVEGASYLTSGKETVEFRNDQGKIHIGQKGTMSAFTMQVLLAGQEHVLVGLPSNYGSASNANCDVDYSFVHSVGLNAACPHTDVFKSRDEVISQLRQMSVPESVIRQVLFKHSEKYAKQALSRAKMDAVCECYVTSTQLTEDVASFIRDLQNTDGEPILLSLSGTNAGLSRVERNRKVYVINSSRQGEIRPWRWGKRKQSLTFTLGLEFNFAVCKLTGEIKAAPSTCKKSYHPVCTSDAVKAITGFPLTSRMFQGTEIYIDEEWRPDYFFASLIVTFTIGRDTRLVENHCCVENLRKSSAVVRSCRLNTLVTQFIYTVYGYPVEVLERCTSLLLNSWQVNIEEGRRALLFGGEHDADTEARFVSQVLGFDND